MKAIAIVSLMVGAAGTAFGTQSDLEYPRIVDPGGCILEIVATSDDRNHHQFNGFSPDGRLFAAGWYVPADENRPDEVQREAYLLNLETGERVSLPGLDNVASFSPDGSHLVSAAYQDGGRTDIVLYSLASGETEILAAHDNWDFLPSFSPDGRQIVFHSSRAGNPDLYLYDLESRVLTQLTTNENWETHAQFSPDGAFISYNERLSETQFDIRLLELATGETLSLTDQPSEDAYPSWHPDGKHLVFTSNRDRENGPSDVYVMSRDGEVLVRLTNAPFYHGYPTWSPDGHYLYFTTYRQPQGIYRLSMNGPTECRRPADQID